MKRAFDLLVCVLLLPVWSIAIMVIGAAVLVCLGRPIFFVQLRTGRYGKVFPMVKFRTMAVSSPDSVELPDADRLSRFGIWLRKASLDEVPELLNVLVGHMSLVGPRPLLPMYMDRYTPEQGLRHTVRPGVTGLAQVLGRNSISWSRKLSLDVWYAKNRTLALDIKILFRTFTAVIGARNVGPLGSSEMPDFRKLGRDR